MGKLVTLLNNTQINTVGDDQGRWRQFILDHLDYIAKRSKIYTLTESDFTLYAYDLKRYLSQALSRRGDIGWIVQLLNDLPNDLEFDTPGDFVIPTDEIIDRLYHSYQAINANQT